MHHKTAKSLLQFHQTPEPSPLSCEAPATGHSPSPEANHLSHLQQNYQTVETTTSPKETLPLPALTIGSMVSMPSPSSPQINPSENWSTPPSTNSPTSPQQSLSTSPWTSPFPSERENDFTSFEQTERTMQDLIDSAEREYEKFFVSQFIFHYLL